MIKTQQNTSIADLCSSCADGLRIGNVSYTDIEDLCKALIDVASKMREDELKRPSGPATVSFG